MKKVIVDVYGGIGNQIFQYVFAKYLEDQGFKISISTAYNKVHNNKNVISRDTILNPLIFGFNDIFWIYKYLFKFFDSRFYQFLDKNKTFINKFVKEFSWQNERNFNLENFETLNRVTGHWQFVDLMLNYKEFVINSLAKLYNDQNIRKIIPFDNKVAVHVRRGDYIGLNKNLSLKYYEQALSEIEKKLTNFEFEVFSDDIEWAKNQRVFLNANKFWDYEDGEKVNLRDFKELLNFKHLIISNSTFSLIPALFNSSFNGIVVFPENWLSEEIAKINNKNWICAVND